MTAAGLNQLVGTFLTNLDVTVAEWVEWVSNARPQDVAPGVRRGIG